MCPYSLQTTLVAFTSSSANSTMQDLRMTQFSLDDLGRKVGLTAVGLLDILFLSVS